jgi:hypothetical protein
MNIDESLPTNYEAERKLLSALLVMLPTERDAAIGKISAVWFADPWHRRLFNVLTTNRRRDFGKEILDAMRDEPGDRTAWWISQLLCDNSGESVSGRPQIWKEYAHVLEKIYSYRVRILLAIEQVRDLVNAARTETYAIHDDTDIHAGTADRAEGPRAGNLQHRAGVRG